MSVLFDQSLGSEVVLLRRTLIGQMRLLARPTNRNSFRWLQRDSDNRQSIICFVDTLRDTGADVQGGKSEVVRRTENEEGAWKRRRRWIGDDRNWKRRRKKVSSAQRGDGHCVHRAIDDQALSLCQRSFRCPMYPKIRAGTQQLFLLLYRYRHQQLPLQLEKF